MAEIKFEESFIENSPTTRAVIRKYIIRHNLIPYVCEKCGKIIDLVKTQPISNPYGLVINRSSVTYYGLCDDCQK